jgi:hypothetical protein
MLSHAEWKRPVTGCTDRVLNLSSQIPGGIGLPGQNTVHEYGSDSLKGNLHGSPNRHRLSSTGLIPAMSLPSSARSIGLPLARGSCPAQSPAPTIGPGERLASPALDDGRLPPLRPHHQPRLRILRSRGPRRRPRMDGRASRAISSPASGSPASQPWCSTAHTLIAAVSAASTASFHGSPSPLATWWQVTRTRSRS